MQNAIAQQPAIAAPKGGGQSCHGGPQVNTAGLPLVTLVGSPNVGKSVLFNILTGVYVTVSNYPGTTVEVTRGKGRFGALETGVMDTPGMYGLLPITEEERVARQILLNERPDVVVHVVDAKNVQRMLPMTLQLIEAGLPVVLVLNLMDEADRIGVKIDVDALQMTLGVPVLATALALGRGAKELKAAIAQALVQQPAGAWQPAAACCADRADGSAVCCDGIARPTRPATRFAPAVEASLQKIEALLADGYSLTRRATALLLLQNDAEVGELVERTQPADFPAIAEVVREAQAQSSQPLAYQIARAQRDAALRILDPVLTLPGSRPSGFASRLSEIMIRPLTGLPILLAALYLLYQFVGVFGAQTLVGFLEETLFESIVNPWVDRMLALIIPWPVLQSLFGGEFGVITLGFRYAFAIVLPIVGTFFLAFSIIEDSGYLPRLALLIDRVFKRIGLNGRAVIPMVLGFGCDTMATIVTRTLETRRERFLATLLLSLAVPCSAQLGVMLGLLSGSAAMLAVWLGIIAGVFLLVGFLAAKLTPGERPAFYMELPPLRLPTLRNVLVKTYTRMEWYLREVFPLFIIASVLIWVGQLTGLFDLGVRALVPVVRLLGLPDQTAMAFLFGFFRRDYGAAGLYDMQASLTSAQILVSTVTMTLFLPCIAQFSVTVKERGIKTALGIAAFIFPFALGVGWLLSLVLRALGMS